MQGRANLPSPCRLNKGNVMKTIGYSEARDSINQLDLIAVAGEDITSRLVQFVTKSDYSHVAATYIHSNMFIPKRVMLFESTPARGVHLSALSRRNTFYWFPLTKNYYSMSGERFIWRLMCRGAPYDRLSLISRSLGFWPKDDRQFYCSELCWSLYRQCGINLADGAGSDPGTLIWNLQELGVIGEPIKVVNDLLTKRGM